MIRKDFQIGQYVYANATLHAMCDSTPVPNGMRGVVSGVDYKIGTVEITFDNGVVIVLPDTTEWLK